MKRVWISCLMACGMMFADVPDQHASQQKEATISSLENQIRLLQTRLAEKEEQIRELQAQVQACREQLARAQERVEQVAEPIQRQRLETYHQQLQARQAAERQDAQARRRAARARSESIRRNMDPMGYWLRENPVPYYTAPLYRPYGYGYPYTW
ncbi:MAG: hypothetical protein JW828_02425 [Sedimentisphaerales bacterium]|nr:hypothetical protein [Sedimentisphaerales bacterium]